MDPHLMCSCFLLFHPERLVWKRSSLQHWFPWALRAWGSPQGGSVTLTAWPAVNGATVSPLGTGRWLRGPSSAVGYSLYSYSLRGHVFLLTAWFTYLHKINAILGHLISSKLAFSLQKRLMDSILNVEHNKGSRELKPVFLGLIICGRKDLN